MDTWAPPSGKLLLVTSQRGVSGIDGVVSGAAGVASAVAGPTTLLIGDVSFFTTPMGSRLASRVAGPLVIVVVNNGGGRIFEQLPIAQDGNETWLPYFTTPHAADLESAAAIYGCEFQSVDTVTGLRQGLEVAYGREGCTVIEAVRSSAERSEAGPRADQSCRTGTSRGFLMWTLLHGFTGSPESWSRVVEHADLEQAAAHPDLGGPTAAVGSVGDVQSFENEVTRLSPARVQGRAAPIALRVFDGRARRTRTSRPRTAPFRRGLVDRRAPGTTR